MERNLAVGATSGSVSAIFFRLLGSVLETPTLPCDCDCGCPLCTDLPQLIIQKLDIFSLLVGILCGLCICPVLDLIHLIRQELGGLVAILRTFLEPKAPQSTT